MKNLFGEEVAVPSKPRNQRTTKKAEPQGIGCEFCSMNEVDGIHKVINIDKIRGKKLMVWAQSPGKNENIQQKELIGDSGKFLWQELEPFGISRTDCDIQNIVRCRPYNHKLNEEYSTTSKEFKKIARCCSIYNPQAIDANKGQAQVHLILGKAAGLQLLGKHYKKEKAVIWYEPWNAYVVLADHPSYLLRMGGRKAGWAYYTFRDRMKAVKTVLNYPGRWGYIKAQDYGKVETEAEMKELKEWIYDQASLGESVSVDIEDGEVDGKRVCLLIGFGWGKYKGSQGSRKTTNASWQGGARSVVLYHPKADQSVTRIQPLLEMTREIIEDSKIKKTLQNGSYDDHILRELLGWKIRGYEYDTRYATYLKHPHLRSYSLEKQVQLFLPEFQDYKDMMEPYYETGFAQAPLDLLVSYNCADCDATQRLRTKTQDAVSFPLLQVYIHCAYILDGMEERGPLLDQAALDKLAPVVHEQVENLRSQLEQIVGGEKENFNPNTPAHIAWLIFDKLKLPQIEGRSTTKEIMETLLIQTKSKVPQLINDYRSLSKLEGTYLKGYAKSASLHNGRLRTIWHLTGAVTGRLRSGKGDKAETEEGIINLQNIDGRPILQDLLVSDLKWRKAL